ncbi:MAG: hypothetical protein M3447_07560 [Acidobacteriota bacterium]|nr:hypothetical protein [Acidobacteriota bacterium]
MKQQRRTFIFILAAFLMFGAGRSLAQSGSAENSVLPSGNWTVSFGPYAGPGYESAPVQLVSIKGEVRRDGLMMFKAPHWVNHSNKDVRSVEHTVYVYKEPESKPVLFRQRYDRVSFTGGVPLLARSELRMNNRWLQSFASRKDGLMQPLIKEGKLEGSYRIALGISKVYFADDSVWEIQDTDIRVN